MTVKIGYAGAFLLVLSLLLTSSRPMGVQTVTLDADGPGNTYELINSVFGSSAASEVPDCYHQVRHIREGFDPVLGRYVFLFDIHVDSIVDNDRCTNYDRQRNEIKTVSPDNITGQPGETHIYKWKFKMDSLFQASPNFCHLHQIKATGGDDDDAPLMTITPRKYSDPTQPEWLQLIFTPSTGASGAGTLKQVELKPLKGIWLDVTEKVLYSDDGKYELTIKKLDGTVVMSYSNYFLDMFRAGANFHRGKWGIYRSLNSPTYLRDETVAFANFSITEGEVNSTPVAPGRLIATPVSDKQIDLTWTDNSSNKTNFLIQKSTDGISWSTVIGLNANVTKYSHTGLAPSTTYAYRIRAENWNAFSAYSDTAKGTTLAKTVGVSRVGTGVPDDYTLNAAYPNPFNPSTMLSYQIPVPIHVELAIFDVAGRQVQILVNQNQQAGRYECAWNSHDSMGKPANSGVYFARLQAGTYSRTIKLVLMK
jgi:hypothetical protein